MLPGLGTETVYDSEISMSPDQKTGAALRKAQSLWPENLTQCYPEGQKPFDYPATLKKSLTVSSEKQNKNNIFIIIIHYSYSWIFPLVMKMYAHTPKTLNIMNVHSSFICTR